MSSPQFLSPPSLAPGYRLDRYELLCPLARGGMAEVWYARLLGKHGFEKHFAIKTILPAYASDPAFQSMFLDEARITSSIVHPNVVHVLDLGEQDGVLYLVMEWVEGDSLQQLYRTVTKQGGRIPAGILLRMMCDICAGLHASHELRDKDGVRLGVVHRDVSPPNILLTLSTGVAKLIDFGVAKARDRLAADTSVGLMKGKVEYMAPEQALSGVVDQRVDIWAVGAILFKLLTGAAPYRSDSQLSVLRRLTSGEPCDPLPDSVPEPVAALIRRALAIQPEDRFATADEMREAIEQAMVAADLVTTTAMVAAYLGEHFKARVTERKALIHSSIRLADDRSSHPGRLPAGSIPPPPSPTGFGSVRPEATTGAAVVAPDPPPTAIVATGTSSSPPGARRGQAIAALVAVAVTLGVTGLVARGRGAPPTTAITPLAAAPPPALAPSAEPRPVVSVETAVAPASASASASPLAPEIAHPVVVVAGKGSLPAAGRPSAVPTIADPVVVAPPPPSTPPSSTAPRRPDLGY